LDNVKYFIRRKKPHAVQNKKSFFPKKVSYKSVYDVHVVLKKRAFFKHVNPFK